jgi:hypothetical protein
MSAGISMTLFQRLRFARIWVALQFILTLVLLAAGLGWTRLPDKHVWQVALTLMVPVLLLICFLELQAGTMRKLADDKGGRASFGIGAASLLGWLAVGAVAWVFLDWCDSQFPLWAGYLNSKFGTQARATTFTYEHILRWLTAIEWVLRWVALPGKLIPFAAASAQWAWRLPVRRVIRFLWNWRWWLGLIIASLVGAWLPSQFFDKPPSGSVSAQEWHVGLKLAGAYLLAVTSWVLLLGWWATLFAVKKQRPSDEDLVAVPVLSGPPLDRRSAKAEIPPPDTGPVA